MYVFLKFQMLFEQNVISNVTSNQEPLHKILLKHYFFVQIPLVGAFWAKIEQHQFLLENLVQIR